MRSSGWALGANISFVISGTPPDFSVAWRALSGACQHFSTPPGFAPPRCPNTRCSDVVYAATNGRGLVVGTDLAGGPGPIGPARCGLSRHREFRLYGVLGSCGFFLLPDNGDWARGVTDHGLRYVSHQRRPYPSLPPAAHHYRPGTHALGQVDAQRQIT